MPRRYAAKVDANQAEIVQALRRVGAVFVPTYRHGDGTPDGFVLYRTRWYAFEIKMPGQRLTVEEEVLHARCDGAISIVHAVDEALAAIGAVVS